MFETVVEGVTLFHKVAASPLGEDSNRSRKGKHLSLSLVAEEFIELLRDGFGVEGTVLSNLEEALSVACTSASYNTPDLTQTCDATGDLIYVVNRLGLSLGLDMDKVSKEVQKSNMSKFTTSHEEALRSRDYYEALGRDVIIDEVEVIREGTLTVRVWYVIKDENTGKILKCQDTFREPDFTKIVGELI